MATRAKRYDPTNQINARTSRAVTGHTFIHEEVLRGQWSRISGSTHLRREGSSTPTSFPTDPLIKQNRPEEWI